jgi:DNA-binding transcriptional LysR family regulator
MPTDPLPPDFYTGAPIDPSDLWFRDPFIYTLWDTLDTQHAILTAPRRTGKTSVMDHLAANPRLGFSPVSVFVQDLDHPADFILTLLDAFHDRHPAFFRETFSSGAKLFTDVLSRLQEIGVSGFKVALREGDPHWRESWKRHGDDFFRQVRQAKRRVLFIVDEFPDMIINMEKGSAETVGPFLAWFRGHRQNPHPKHDPIRWLLGGSVNLSSTLDALGCLDEINDFHDEPLPPLTEPEVTEFVEKMLQGRGVDLDPAVAPDLAKALGRPVPLFLQMITQDLYRIWKKERRKLVVADVHRAFDDLIVSSAARDKLQHYYSRIAQYYLEPKRSAAYEILGRLSLSDGLRKEALFQEFERILQESGITPPSHERQRLFNQLLRDLENDFYVAEVSPGLYDFASGLIKAWWKKYYA